MRRARLESLHAFIMITVVFRANKNETARTWLGLGLDMTLTTPTDINSIANHVLRVSRLLKLSETSTQRTVESIAWSVPDNIVFCAGTNTSSSRFPHPFNQAVAKLTVSGAAAPNAIRSDASISARFMAVSGSASLHHSVAQSFNISMQYSMFSFSHTLARVRFDSWGANIDSDVLKQRLTGVVPFPLGNDPDPAITSAYASLFRNMGNHHIRCENSDTSVNQNFNANLSFAFKGLITGGSVDASVAGPTSISTSPIRCKRRAPDWVKTNRQHPSITSVQTTALWDVMSASPDTEVSSRARDVEKAYLCIVAHPSRHWSKCRLDINADWGEIRLLTPSAFMRPDPHSPIQRSDVGINPANVQGSNGDHHPKRVTIDFIIENDGGAVDIELARRDNGDKRGVTNGSCEVVIHNRKYANRG
ncbi:hypothetical protein QBC43DRAFT_293133 [Cladorrhinum sp. PSN259]|nr:hypothetical protein QBC43DRAFT_293133 [Cladorrhinum sp. PSN259]